MFTCEAEYADMVIDGRPYYIESLQELCALYRLRHGRKGIVFNHLGKTRGRLELDERDERRVIAEVMGGTLRA